MPVPTTDPQILSWGVLTAVAAGFLALLKKMLGVKALGDWFRPRDPDCEKALAAMTVRVDTLQGLLSNALVSLARQEEHSKWQDTEIARLKSRTT